VSVIYFILKNKFNYLVAALLTISLWLTLKITAPLKTDKLIAWQSNKDFLVTQLKGDSCIILSTITSKQLNRFKWISSNALDHWQSWKIREKPISNVHFKWGQYQIALIDSIDKHTTLGKDPVDYVFCFKIKDTNCLLQIHQNWHPKTIILVNGSSHYKTEQLSKYATNKSIPLYTCLDSGAFVLE
jgi:hypothetical protein